MPSASHRSIPSAAAFLCLLLGLAPEFLLAEAATEWALCGPELRIPMRVAPEHEQEDREAVYIAADDVDLIEEGRSILRGDVQLLKGRQQLQADQVVYDKQQELLEAAGNVRFWDQGLYVSGERGSMDVASDNIWIRDAHFLMEAEHGRGEAQGVTITGSNVLRAQKGTYTTCNPGSNDWLLRGRNIKLNKETDTGQAWNVLLRFKGVPILYSPYLRFPLSDQRKTGFLAPRVGASGEAGLEATIPYYWNIAPNQDATFSIRGMTKRGVLLGGEYRYLTRQASGELGGEYLPLDLELDEPRWALKLRNQWSPARRWNTVLDINQVSDDNYLEDLSTSLEISSTQFLERRGDVQYTGNGWWARGRLQSFQTVDETITPTERPYAQLPQLLVSSNLPERNWRFNFSGEGEFVNFERSAGVTGTRAGLVPSVSFPIRTPGIFFVPRFKLNYTEYQLRNTRAGEPDTPTRLLPTVSVDTGLFFERDWQLGDTDLRQSLEPRLYYLYVPFEEQEDLPVFDTGEFTFGFGQLFRDNRFDGPDRIGDANQLTLALTTRLFSPTSGDEFLRASVGQIRFFRDREVTLPGDSPNTSPSSDIVADMIGFIADRWRISAGLQWDTQEGRATRRAVSLRYQPDLDRVVNLAYRFREDVVDQTDFSFRWPVHKNWGVVGRWTYAFDEKTTVETFAGFEYESCCWAVRGIARRYLANTRGEFNNAVFFQFELKGLGGLGQQAAAFLRQSIPGYEPEF
jgi:LPS-assembly protein